MCVLNIIMRVNKNSKNKQTSNGERRGVRGNHREKSKSVAQPVQGSERVELCTQFLLMRGREVDDTNRRSED